MRHRRKRKIRIDRLFLVMCTVFGIAALSVVGLLTVLHKADEPVLAVTETEIVQIPSDILIPKEPEPAPEEAVTEEEPVQESEDDSRYYSLLVVANKKNALPYDFEPWDLRVVNTAGSKTCYMRDEAASALETMYAAASAEGITLISCSGYRSASYQDTVYNRYVSMYGVAGADSISSRPGHSDHQTGLVMDIGDHDQATVFTQAMEDTVEGQWLYAHAHEYGFILRYPKGKESITGYSFEPWHYRYVGADTATAMYSISPDYTLEEYLGVEGGDYE